MNKKKQRRSKQVTTGSDFSKFPKIRKQTDATKIHESFRKYKTWAEKNHSLRAANRNSSLIATFTNHVIRQSKKKCANCLKKFDPFLGSKKINNRKKNLMQLSCRFIV